MNKNKCGNISDMSNMDAVIMLGVLTMIDIIPEVVGHTLEEFGKKRSMKNLERKRKKIRTIIKAEPEKFIGRTLEELNILGIQVNQAQLNAKLTQAVQRLTDSNRQCLEYKLFDIPGRRLERSWSDNTAKWHINRLFIGCYSMIWIGIGQYGVI